MSKYRRSMVPPARLPELPAAALALDPKARTTKLGMEDLFPPRRDMTCRCGCGLPVDFGRRLRLWATDDCRKGAVFVYWLWKGDPTCIRWAVYRRDKGVCARCRRAVPGGMKGRWQTHHAIRVTDGGGRLGIANFVSLCVPCHKTIHGSGKKDFTSLD